MMRTTATTEEPDMWTITVKDPGNNRRQIVFMPDEIPALIGALADALVDGMKSQRSVEIEI